ncbi:hypothetical protein M409DRAFT_63527 [Zasmidium cellare ATCC 36951]|uniref:F-box domain-containing protein n=1 Tax=Zasmidium cellare ATCC 36951 TaxID=1080233 RepID=A0A6A6CY86_ZASCE|nr:uncharacterized protein M409DRAFT_63527 [Zasmidium cellare ATCC 36951]KAF2172015.1 hypothetical protein M409DRAFT_63527 [Zasmidium cellare ATCC 36951]
MQSSLFDYNNPHRNSHSESARPHTVHAPSSGFSFIAEEEEGSEGDITPRASAVAQFANAHLEATRRRLSRDDTANDMHVLAAQGMDAQFERGVSPRDVSMQDTQRAQASVRRPFSRVPSHGSSIAGSSDSAQGETKSASLGRRFSRHYRERVHELRETVKACQLPVVSSGRSRRSSTPHRLEFAAGAEAKCDASSRPPTSPSKRTARQGDDRPRKHRAPWLLGDRKDTPAPAANGIPMRPASSRVTPTILAAPGGEGARKAAAQHNHTSSAMQWSNINWGPFGVDDIHERRGRLGSLSSAADSGADLSTYSGSDTSIRDRDGDVDMSADVPSLEESYTTDFTRYLPDEIALQIFEYLDASDLLRAESVSKKWNNMIKEPSVWRNIFLAKYQREVMSDPAPIQVGGLGIGRPNKPNQEWRKMYKARVELEENWRAGQDNAGKAVYLSGHTDSVYCLQFDEEKIITGSRDRTIRVWDINTFQCLRVIGGPNVRPQLGPKVLRTVDYPSFHMATASVNGTTYGDSIYHIPTQWHDASILCLQYDDEILVTGSSDSDLLVWDIKTYEPIRRLRKHSGGVLDVALDKKHIVSCSKDSRIIVWDRSTYEPKGELTGHRGPVNAVQLRGHLLVSASGDGIARLWDLKQMKLIKEFSAKERGLAAVEFSEDMKHVLAGGNDNITYKFETETGREVLQFTGHTQLVRSLWLDSGNKRVVSGSYDLDLRVYDFETGKELWRGEEWTTSWMLAAKSDYRRIVATSQDGRILIVDFGILKGAPNWSSRDGNPIENIELLRGIENTNEIRFTNPFDSNKRVLTRS